MIIPGKDKIKKSIQEYFDDKGQCKLTMSKLRIKVLKLCKYTEEEYSIVNATLRKLLLEIINDFEAENEDKVKEMPLPQITQSHIKKSWSSREKVWDFNEH